MGKHIIQLDLTRSDQVERDVGAASALIIFTFMTMSVLGFILFSTVSTYAVCPDGISAYWNLDEAAGDNP